GAAAAETRSSSAGARSKSGRARRGEPRGPRSGRPKARRASSLERGLDCQRSHREDLLNRHAGPGWAGCWPTRQPHVCSVGGARDESVRPARARARGSCHMSTSTSPEFADLFGAPAVVFAWAPGRVNLIGDHTDYQGGLVLPLALRRGTRIDLRPRSDDLVRLFSANLPETGMRQYQLGAEHRAGDWADYVRGITAELRAAGYAIAGFDALVTSDLPVGSGLSSSGALEVSALRALCRGFALALDDKTIAHLARRAETELVGVPACVMDQIACSVGDPSHALFLDTRSLLFDRVTIPAALDFVVIDAGIPHRDGETGYRRRRQEAEQAAFELDVPLLRDLTVQDLARLTSLPPLLARRVRHVVTENTRVPAFRAALGREDRDE